MIKCQIIVNKYKYKRKQAKKQQQTNKQIKKNI